MRRNAQLMLMGDCPGWSSNQGAHVRGALVRGTLFQGANVLPSGSTPQLLSTSTLP